MGYWSLPIYISSLDLSFEVHTYISNCLLDKLTWISNTYLKPNKIKVEFLKFLSQTSSSYTVLITVNGNNIHSMLCPNTLDSFLSLQFSEQLLSALLLKYPQNLTTSYSISQVWVTITSHLHYCNSLPTIPSVSTIDLLLSILHRADRVIF